MKFMFIVTLLISTCSVAASIEPPSSKWEGWDLPNLATFLKTFATPVTALSHALEHPSLEASTSEQEGWGLVNLTTSLRQYAPPINYLLDSLGCPNQSKHSKNIKEALTAQLQCTTQYVESCAKAFYALYLQTQYKNSSNETTPLLTGQPLIALDESELFKNAELHPTLSNLIEEYACPTFTDVKPHPAQLGDPFPCVRYCSDAKAQTASIGVPLYILEKHILYLQKTHLDIQTADALIPTSSPPATIESALCSVYSGAVFIYAVVPIAPRSSISFIAYETQPHPESPLHEISENHTEFRKAIERCVQSQHQIYVSQLNHQ